MNSSNSFLRDRVLIRDSSLPAALLALSNPVLPNAEPKTASVKTDQSASGISISNISNTLERVNPFGKRKIG